MDPSNSHIEEYDEEMGALESLLNAFGSVCSLEEIASAYCKAGRDVCKAGDILYQFQESKPNGVSHARDSEIGFAQSEESLHKGNAVNSSLLHKNLKGSKPRKLSASVGTVSSVLGKTYGRAAPSLNESCGTTKPLKLEVEKSLIDDLEVEAAALGFETRKETLSSKDVEDFLFSMLGDGFKLSMDVIREVLGQCGYDVKKGMEELLVVSAKTLEKGKAIDCDMVEKFTGKCPEMESCLPEENCLRPVRNLAESLTQDKEKSNLPREVLEALFSVPERSEEPKRKHLEWGLNRRRVIGQRVVTKPLDDIVFKHPTDIPKIKPDIKDVVDDEDEYQVLRRAVKLHWDTMKTYYEAAIDAFTTGDRAQANYLLEQGKYYNQMAREADNKSSGEILETRTDCRKTDIQADITLDLHAHDAKDAVRNLKLHLRSLACIHSFKFLKVIVDTDAEDVTKGKRKRLVMKLLERESIEWTKEEGNPGSIFIQMDVIDPNKLSFVKGSE